MKTSTDGANVMRRSGARVPAALYWVLVLEGGGIGRLRSSGFARSAG
jgi:hypothetical protein